MKKNLKKEKILTDIFKSDYQGILDTTEYIYFDDEWENIIYTSRNNPLKYEDQTPCVKLQTEKEEDMDKILDLLNLK